MDLRPRPDRPPDDSFRLSPGIAAAASVSRSCRAASDEELTERLTRASGVESRVAAVLVAHLGEFDERRLWAGLGYPSLFSYCVSKLGMSEQAAYKRIAAGRAARRHPVVLERLCEGRVHLSAVAVLAPHLTDQNAADLLDLAEGKSKFELERIVAALAPEPDRRDVVRRLPRGSGAGTPSLDFAPGNASSPPESAPAPAAPPPALPAPSRQRVRPLSPGRVSFSFTGSERLHRKLERVKELRWHCDPKGRLERLIEDLADFYLNKKDPDRRLAREEKRGGGRPHDYPRG